MRFDSLLYDFGKFQCHAPEELPKSLWNHKCNRFRYTSI